MADVPRVLCLEVLLFPLAARLRSEPELREEAVAVLEGSGARARIVAATRRARQAGIRAGQTLAQARIRLPRLVARARDPSCERAAQEALLDVAEGISPRVEDDSPGRIYLDTTGLARHYPDAEDPEHALATSLLYAVEKNAGLSARIGIAGSKLAARVAASKRGGPTRVPRGREASFLAPLPLSRLLPAGELLSQLDRWGIHTAGAFARLSADAVTSRLGEAGRQLHALARGRDPQPLVPRKPPPTFVEGMELEWPLVDLEAFGFVARAALERLTARMAAHGVGCLRLDLSLELEPQGHHERSLTLPAPTRDVKTLVTLMRLDLERQRPGAPVRAFTLTAHPDQPRAAQLTLFGPEALSPERLATTLARLFALLGEDRVGAPSEVDAHRPEGYALVPYKLSPPPSTRRPPPPSRGLLAVRVLRPPIPLDVTLESASVPGDTFDESTTRAAPRYIEAIKVMEPQSVTRSTRYRSPHRSPHRPLGHPVKRPHIAGTVRVAAGPWSLEEDWWTEQPIRRIYWDVELDGGGLYRIYHDQAGQDWFADGVYD
jgi:protein ImuB